MITIITTALFIMSIVIILVGFLMAPDSNSFSGALVGSSDLELFSNTKERGYKKILKWLMIIFGLLMFISTILIRIFV